ncbi:DUF3667 domain-containing protein [Flavobacterium humi]|uniref:DUF3667 domain-containing protein n=1 Tax=Flavobacterium humi TaxID=2562683 RepID=A0A4Z0L6G3_9FLAO|nr:DUF3667 domain-containing protein [Flavobacterium humi]TGD57577.1 DUF3667 domain-containing protein [Flavobacterium humi]
MDFCKNCHTANPEQYNYCPQCSQKTSLHRLTSHDIAHEAIHYFTHADKGFFQLIRDLILKRGVVAREYVNGRRKKYFPPLSFFMLIATVFVFMATLGEPKKETNILKAHPELSSIADPVKKQLAIEKLERGEKVNHFTTKYSNLMAMCSLPLTALVFWLFYRKGKYNYVEHLVAGMYMLGICILIYALLILPLSYLFGFSGNYAVLIFFVVQLLYFSTFYYGFLEKTTKLHFAKAFGVSVASLVVWVLFSGSLIRFYIMSGFGGLFH